MFINLYFVGVGCLVGSFFIFAKQLRIASWGANIRMAIATVVVFWTPWKFWDVWISSVKSG